MPRIRTAPPLSARAEMLLRNLYDRATPTPPEVLAAATGIPLLSVIDLLCLSLYGYVDAVEIERSGAFLYFVTPKGRQWLTGGKQLVLEGAA